MDIGNENYKQWRKNHIGAFGKLYSNAFDGDESSQYLLTNALALISGRKFEEAYPALLSLEKLCVGEHDNAAMNYFIGLDLEFMGKEEEMEERYDALKDLDCDLDLPLSFLPYYRTAKFAQREAQSSLLLRKSSADV